MGKEIIYDELDIVDSQVQYCLENREEMGIDPNATEDSIREDVYKDDYIFQEAWDFFLESVTSLINRGESFPPYWAVAARNADWRGSSFISFDESRDFKTLIGKMIGSHQVGPVRAQKNGNGIEVWFTHHDCPVNPTRYLAVPVSERTFNQRRVPCALKKFAPMRVSA